MTALYANPLDPLNKELRSALGRATNAVNDEEVAAWYRHLTGRRPQLTPHRARVESLIASLDRLAEEHSDAHRDMTRIRVVLLCRDLGMPLPVDRAKSSRRMPTWLAGCAARVLPAPSRARYREEFEAELSEVGRGWRQGVHGLRVLVRAVPLRWELQRPARERAR